jgi:hypothetical protein
MNQSVRPRILIGLVLFTLAFIGPFIIYFGVMKLWNVHLPSWVLYLFIIGGGLLSVEVLYKYEPRMQQSKGWGTAHKRNRRLYVVTYATVVWLFNSRDELAAGTKLPSALFLILSIVLFIGFILYVFFQDRHKPIA